MRRCPYTNARNTSVHRSHLQCFSVLATCCALAYGCTFKRPDSRSEHEPRSCQVPLDSAWCSVVRVPLAVVAVTLAPAPLECRRQSSQLMPPTDQNHAGPANRSDPIWRAVGLEGQTECRPQRRECHPSANDGQRPLCSRNQSSLAAHELPSPQACNRLVSVAALAQLQHQRRLVRAVTRALGAQAQTKAQAPLDLAPRSCLRHPPARSRSEAKPPTLPART